MPKAGNPPNSEVSEHFLRLCAGAPAVMNDMQLALQTEHGSYKKILSEEVLRGFGLSELVSRVRGQ
jgi:hypothetical protein